MRWISTITLFVLLAIWPSVASETGTEQDNATVPAPQDAITIQKEPTPDFRNVKWGMTVEEVKQRETAAFSKEDSWKKGGRQWKSLKYDVVVDSDKGQLTYYFIDGYLSESSYHFSRYAATESHYDRFKAALSGKYGQPVASDKGWRMAGDIVGRFSEWYAAGVKAHLRWYRFTMFDPQQLVIEYTAGTPGLHKDL